VVDAHELTLRQWIDSVWFRGLARGATLLVSILVSGFIVAWTMVAGDTATKVHNIELVLTGDVPADQSLTRRGSLVDSVASLQLQVGTLSVDTRAIKLLLQDAARKDTALNLMPPQSWLLDTTPPELVRSRP
jgi:hypothetical protein